MPTPSLEQRKAAAEMLRNVDYMVQMALGVSMGGNFAGAALYTIGRAIGLEVSKPEDAGLIFERLADYIYPSDH